MYFSLAYLRYPTSYSGTLDLLVLIPVHAAHFLRILTSVRQSAVIDLFSPAHMERSADSQQRPVQLRSSWRSFMWEEAES